MKLYLKRNEDKRIRTGHLWIYSNEIDINRSPLKQFEPGQLAHIHSANDSRLGTVYVNANSLICARVVSRRALDSLDEAYFFPRLQRALELRERLYALPYYRLVFSEGDFLPGLVVDRYGDALVVQLNTAGMEAAKQAIVDSLERLLQPQQILLKNDSSIRELEALPKYVEMQKGHLDEEILVQENGCQFRCSLSEGQKTGWFYDHRDNRQRMLKYVKDKRVLDVYSYVGAWSICAGHHGAAAITAVDVSENALRFLRQNSELNRIGVEVEVLQDDALQCLRQLHQQERKFDVIVLDPPAFIKRKKDLKPGLEAYAKINRMAMQLLSPGGILISASCSFHLSAEMLQNILLKAASKSGRRMQILEQGFQGPDHPWHPAIPETKYLKTFFCRMLN